MGHVGSGDYLRRATELVRRSVLERLGIAHIGGVSILCIRRQVRQPAAR